MRNPMRTKLFRIFALTLIVGAFFVMGATTAYAVEYPSPDEQESELDLSGNAIHDYDDADATSEDGEQPQYAEPLSNPYSIPLTDGDYYANGMENESAIPDGSKPFTPDGTGTVLDNAMGADGKEFFTIETPDGSVFYIIIDRQRSNDNVYLLNAVTEYDLLSLAKPGDGKSVSAIETPQTQVTPEPQESTPESTPTPNPSDESGNNGTLIFIVIAAVVVGGAGYYFKILRPKQLGSDGDDEYGEETEDGDDSDEVDEDEEFDVTNEDDEEDDDE